MRLDEADLALLEIDAQKFGEQANRIIQALISRIREQGVGYAVKDEIASAHISVKALRRYLDKALEEAEDIDSVLKTIVEEP